MKLRVPPGPARAEVMQLVDVFRARVVDVSEKTLTVAVTGDAGKVNCTLACNFTVCAIQHAVLMTVRQMLNTEF